MLFIPFTVALAALAVAEVPDFIDVCGRKNPQLNECVKQSVEKIRPKLGPGIPSLDVPSIEPLRLKQLTIANETNFKAFAENVDMYGLSNFQIKSLQVELEKNRFELDLVFDEIKLDADYDVSTKIGVPIAHKGPINIKTDGVTAKAVLIYKLVKHKGAEYMFFPSMTLKLVIKDYESEFKPSGNDDGAIAAGINSVLSNSRQEIIETITPNLEVVISETVLKLANQICKHFTFLELFPDRE